MSEREKNPPNRVPQLQGPPDGYIRRSTLLQTLGALVGIFGAIVGLYRFLDARDSRTRDEVRNERTERIDADSRINARIDRCCSRGGG